MPKELIQKLIHKFIPDPDVIKGHKNLQFLGEKLHEPNLWHLNRRSIALAFAVGLFCAWIPSPMQMAFAASGAIYFRANIPISVALVWITNPITMPPLFYFAYEVGLWFMNQPASTEESQFSLSAVFSGLADVWQPFLAGCFIMGIISSAIGYFGIHYYWQYHINKKWAERKDRRLKAKELSPR
ncbi:MAG: hypothetical protein RI893_950 [Pseudomonadota bacterium]|jgi:uncharacterized protein (DUF2062 family)